MYSSSKISKITWIFSKNIKFHFWNICVADRRLAIWIIGNSNNKIIYLQLLYTTIDPQGCKKCTYHNSSNTDDENTLCIIHQNSSYRRVIWKLRRNHFLEMRDGIVIYNITHITCGKGAWKDGFSNLRTRIWESDATMIKATGYKS